MVQVTGFIGFPDVKMKPIIVPDRFFSDLLPQIDDLAELKLTLHCFWLINERSGDYRYLTGDDLRRDETLLASLNLDSDLRTPLAALEDALQRAVARNTLLRLEIETAADTDQAICDDWYFMNTVKGRQAIAKIRQGRLRELRAAIPEEARLRVGRSNLFKLYEQNIGLMTPLIADRLRDIEKSYPPDWIEEAFEIAVSRNKRNLRYIEAICKRWERDGKDDFDNAKPIRDTEEQRRRDYLPDEFSDIILG